MRFDRASTGENVYTVDILNTRTTFQFDRHFFVRAIVQYDSSRHQVLTDFLASWELLPGTVAYAGYGSILERRGWDGSGDLRAGGEVCILEIDGLLNNDRFYAWRTPTPSMAAAGHRAAGGRAWKPR